MKSLIDKIKKLRKDKNLTLKEVSEKLGISLTAYNQIELGNTALTLERVYQFSDIFEISVAELLDIETNILPADNSKELEILKKELEELKKDFDNLKEINGLQKYKIEKVEKDLGQSLENTEALLNSLIVTIYKYETSYKGGIIDLDEFSEDMWKKIFSYKPIIKALESKLVDDRYLIDLYQKYKNKE